MPSKQTKQKNSEIHQKERGRLNIHLTFKKGINDDEELVLWQQIFRIVDLFEDEHEKLVAGEESLNKN